MIQIEFTGFSGTHPNGFTYDIGSGHDFYLLIVTSTPAVFWLDKERQTFPSHSAILYTPGSDICYGANGTTFENDWIRFRSDEAFIERLSIKNRPFIVNDPQYCHELIKLITWESNNPAPNSDYIIQSLMNVLFEKLQNSCQTQNKSPHTMELINLRKEIYNQPEKDWTIEDMAERMHLSPSYLHMIYHDLFGVTCLEDVIECRILNAKRCLSATHFPVATVAELCGYRNVEHFCRQFKKTTGMTPGKYRKQCRLNAPQFVESHDDELRSHPGAPTPQEDPLLHFFDQVQAAKESEQKK